MSLPTAIIFINSDLPTALADIYGDGYLVNSDGYIDDGYGYLNNITKNILISQLHINEVITFKEFNDRVSFDPNYAEVTHLQQLKILVILPDFRDNTNRNLADLVLFYSSGQLYVEKNNFGPPGLSLPIDKINIYVLLRDVGSKYVVILPISATKPPKSLGGIVVSQLGDSSGVHDANEDNEYNNPDFINRK